MIETPHHRIHMICRQIGHRFATIIRHTLKDFVLDFGVVGRCVLHQNFCKLEKVQTKSMYIVVQLFCRR